MNQAQRAYLRILSDEACEAFDPDLDEHAAEQRIAELRVRTGRGVHERDPERPVDSVPAEK